MSSAFPQVLADFSNPAPVGVCAIDGEGIIVYVNSKQCENSRLTRDEMVGKNHRAFFYETLKSQNLLDHFDRLQQDGVTFEVTIPDYRRHADGTLLALNVKGYQHGGYTFILTTIERALQTEQARFAQLFEHANDGIFILDRQGRFVAVNHKFTELTGLPREAILGKTPELFLPGRMTESVERLERIMREGKLGPYALEVTTPLGQKVVSLNGFALYDGDAPVGVMNIVRDVTAERLQQRQQQTLYALAHDLVRLTDARGVGQSLFARTQELLGAEYGWLLLLDEEGAELTTVAVGGVYAETWIQERIPLQEPAPATVALRERRVVVVSDLAQSPLASPRIRATYAVVATVIGVPLYHGETAVGSFVVGWERQRDLAPQEIALLETLGNEAALALVRVRLTEQLRASEARYRGLFENANDAIVTFTLEGRVTGVNRGLEVMLGWSRKELIGEHYRKLTTLAAVAMAEERIRRTLAGERLPSIFEVEMVRKDGSVVPVEGRTRLVRNQEGTPIGFQGIYRDISAKKALEQQRAEFLAMLTHDIKNPLTAVLGYADLLDEETVGRRSATEDDFLRRLKDNALTIHALVANYLDLAKVEAGSLVLHKTPQAVGPILQRVVEQYAAAAQRRRLTLELEFPMQQLPLIAADAMALERVFANLVQNAIKFTPETGRVTLTARWCTDGRAEIMVAVQDTGPGIAQEELPTLFRKYQRAAATRHHEGTGLGLFVVKTLVEAHGGRVEVESGLGSGTCFRIFLPAPATL